jgi:hypothetical protein
MPLVAGESLRDRLDRDGKLPVDGADSEPRVEVYSVLTPLRDP